MRHFIGCAENFPLPQTMFLNHGGKRSEETDKWVSDNWIWSNNTPNQHPKEKTMSHTCIHVEHMETSKGFKFKNDK